MQTQNRGSGESRKQGRKTRGQNSNSPKNRGQNSQGRKGQSQGQGQKSRDQKSRGRNSQGQSDNGPKKRGAQAKTHDGRNRSQRGPNSGGSPRTRGSQPAARAHAGQEAKRAPARSTPYEGPKPQTFAELELHPALGRAIADMGFEKPTEIQSLAVPPALDGRDVLGCAATGSGKTAAFLLPILDFLLEEPGKGTRALVLSPTRELAAQIVDHFRELAKHTKLRAAAVFGGVGMEPQTQALKRGVDLVVACPGRLLDHMQHPYARFHDLEFLVLDEADRMLDMGFLPDVKRILGRLPDGLQTLLFSATMPKEIRELTDSMLEDPVRVGVERKQAPAAGVSQVLFPVDRTQKKHLLLELLRENQLEETLVFTRTKRRADRLAKFLDKKGVSADRIHGDRSQGQRTRALDNFKTGKIRVLVATDIAARGIDVEALPHVVNFDVPHMPEDYIHRVGRTARAAATGEAFTFVSPEEENDMNAIERVVGKRIPRRHVEAYAPDPDAPVSLGPAQAQGRGRGRGNPSAGRDRQQDRGQQQGRGRGQGQRGTNSADGGRPRRRAGGEGSEGQSRAGGQGRSGNQARSGGPNRANGQGRPGGQGRSGGRSGNASGGGQRRRRGGARGAQK